jgi:hypothetical protein
VASPTARPNELEIRPGEGLDLSIDTVGATEGGERQALEARREATGAAGGAACTVPVSYQRWLERYCGAGATPATCDLAADPKAQADTVTSVLPAIFAIQDFKMLECGSALPACTGDIIPGPPVQAPCRRLDASPTHTCSFASLPADGHLTCHASSHDQCRTWFEGMLPP